MGLMKRLKILRARIQLTTARLKLANLRDREKSLQNRFHAKSTQGSTPATKALHAVWRNEEKIERLIELNPGVETSAAHWTKLNTVIRNLKATRKEQHENR